ncbi:retrovirus-related pol polyprotein from transposon TNT 1-94 [Tanacetum coccineum]
MQDKNIATSDLKKLIEKCKESLWKLYLINHMLFDNQMLNGFQTISFRKPTKPFSNSPEKEKLSNEIVVQLIIFIVDSGSTKHMTGNLKLLCNFVEKFLGIFHFGNDQFAPILSYGDLNQGNVTIKRVYYVDGLNHNLSRLSINRDTTNIKDVVADSAWIKAMQEELHQFDRLKVWELVDKPFGKMIIKLKWLWKNKKDEDQTVIRNKARLVAKGYAQEEGIGFEETCNLMIYQEQERERCG